MRSTAVNLKADKRAEDSGGSGVAGKALLWMSRTSDTTKQVIGKRICH